MLARPETRLQAIPLYALAALAFAVTLVLRYSAPEGSFGGLTDDHFYFVAQGWQMLFGEWPDRDYFEPGAPLMLAISAGLQVVGGRGIWPEYVFCTTALAAGGAITLVLAARASGSLVLGSLAWLLQLALLPRLYGYPKIVVYAAAVAAMWAWAAAPRRSRTWVVGAVTAVGFLLRHDHGVYVAIAFLVLIGTVLGLAWRERLRHAALFVLATGLLLTPYLGYLQWNGGIERHFVSTYAWAARDYLRAPRVLPAFELRPLFDDTGSTAPVSEWWEHAPFTVLSEYSTFWFFWLFKALLVVALAMLVIRPPEGPPTWLQERAKILAVIVLGALLDYGFIRGNLAGRLADVTVPVVILAAWVLAGLATMVRSGMFEVGGHPRAASALTRGVVALVAIAAVTVSALVLVRPFRNLLENARVGDGIDGVRLAVRLVTERVQHTWPLDARATETRSDFVLARYLQTCTSPSDRILVTETRPQIVGLAQRAFAAGHVDLRGGGFFGSIAEQQLTVDRWRRQSVPVVIGPTEADYRDWVESLPLVARHLEREYVNQGEKNVGGFRFLLFVHRGFTPVRTFQTQALPCFR